MFISLSVTSILFFITVQSVVLNSTEIHTPNAAIVPKQALTFDQYDLHDGTSTAEGSGDGANLDEYADEDEDEQLSKVTASTSSTLRTTATTTTKRPEKKNENKTKTIDVGVNEFDEDYKDDIEDSVDYNEATTKITSIPLTSTRSGPIVQQPTPIRVFFSFLTRPPIAAGILAGLAIGILTSVILLICLVQRFNKRQRTHSSYTTGLLYPNHYGYSKSPQEFYA